MKLDKLMMSLAGALAFVLSSQAQDFLTNGLVAYFPFNGNAHDESGQGHDGSVIGAVLLISKRLPMVFQHAAKLSPFG